MSICKHLHNKGTVFQIKCYTKGKVWLEGNQSYFSVNNKYISKNKYDFEVNGW